MKRGECAYAPCRAQILTTELFCRKHLAMLESDTVRVLGKTYRPGAFRQSARFDVVFQQALKELLFFVTNGHRMLRAAAFEWDDAPEVLDGTK